MYRFCRDEVNSIGLVCCHQFAYHQTMIAHDIDRGLAQIAAAIAEPARAKMLCVLMDGRARTSTELAVIGEVSASTASVHLSKLREQMLVQVIAQGKHRYYQLASPQVAVALESLMTLSGMAPRAFVPSTPSRLRYARTCYDHMAGEVAVALHNHFMEKNYFTLDIDTDMTTYNLTETGAAFFHKLGIDIYRLQKSRRRFACACLDWSERTPHLGGALGAGLLSYFIQHEWLERDLDSRALQLSSHGKRQFQKWFDLKT